MEHPRWKIWSASDASFNADVAKLYGNEFVAPLSATAASRFIAEGSHVQVWRKFDDPALIAAMTADPSLTHARLSHSCCSLHHRDCRWRSRNRLRRSYYALVSRLRNGRWPRDDGDFLLRPARGDPRFHYWARSSASLLSARGWSGYFRAQGLSILIVAAIAGIFTGIIYLGIDKPPKIDGREIDVGFRTARSSFRQNSRRSQMDTPCAPASMKVIAKIVTDSSIGTRLCAVRIKSPSPGHVDLLTHSSSRSLLASVGNEPTAPQFFDAENPIGSAQTG